MNGLSCNHGGSCACPCVALSHQWSCWRWCSKPRAFQWVSQIFLLVSLSCLQQWEKETTQLLSSFVISAGCRSPGSVAHPGSLCTVSSLPGLLSWLSFPALFSHLALHIFIPSNMMLFSHVFKAPHEGGEAGAEPTPSSRLAPSSAVCPSQLPCLFKNQSILLVSGRVVCAFAEVVFKEGWNTFEGTIVFNLQQCQKGRKHKGLTRFHSAHSTTLSSFRCPSWQVMPAHSSWAESMCWKTVLAREID